ncbi:MAG: family NAD(P)-dependent oxidoreductase [Alphaproteobacteria bacterium]|jgi:short-subunit dehydrogenase|nr:family NAD(P)-dependent oxidoreductase [Alphaproteobacteria bacterium]
MSEPSLPALDDAWAIFGASSGLAREFARHAARHNRPLILAGRDVEDLELDGRDLVLRAAPAVRTMKFDALDPAAAAQAAGTLDAALPGRFNVLIAFGVLGSQAEIEADPALAQEIISTNAGAAIALMLALAPLMERRQGGRLVVVGSVAGDRVRASNLVYGASKAALAGACGPLRARLARSNVTLTLSKPGPLDTAMTFGLARGLPLASAADCARDLWQAAQTGKPVRYFPAIWRWIMLVIRLLPGPVFHRLKF